MDNNSSIKQNDESSKKQMLNLIIEKSVKCSKPTFNRTGMIIEAILSKNKYSLCKLSANGLPDDLPILRSLIWKINLGYLTINSEEWTTSLQSQRKTYNIYKNIFIS